MNKNTLEFNDQPITGNLIIRDLSDNFFVGTEILHYIKVNTHQSAILKSKKFKIQIYYHKNKYTEKQILCLCRLLIKVLQIFEIIFHSHKFVNALIVLTDFKKELPCNTSIIQPQHVNSGSSDGQMINIWRTEEIVKVFAHELVHYFDLDSFLRHPNQKEMDQLKQSFCVKSKIEINLVDVYAEMIANIINSILYSHEYHTNLKRILENETYFILYQIAKILKFYQFESFDDFLSQPCTKYVRQTTQLCSYYIMRGALQYHLFKNPKEFCKYLEQFNQNEKQVIQYISETLKNDQFKNLITKCMKNQELMKQRNLKMSMFDVFKTHLKT
jgi:hypothetical protein